ncbi:MAG: hypothetical protein IJF59_05325, partial [Clostridia bacterium]|nr:hypothetical protein [Clostridia bacterium]
VLTSDNPRTEDPQQIIDDALAGLKSTRIPHAVIIDRTEAIEHALRKAGPGDIVLIAGKGHETYQILASGKIHYDEREIVRDLVAKINAEKAADTAPLPRKRGRKKKQPVEF